MRQGFRPRMLAIRPKRPGLSLALAACCLLALVIVSGGPRASASTLIFVGSEFDGVSGVTGLMGARSAAVSPDGAHLYVASLDAGALAVFSRNPLTGALTFVEAQFDGVGGVDGLNGLLGTHAVALSPDGLNVYVAANTDDAVAVFSRDPETGALSFLEVQRDGVGGVDGLNGSWGVTVSADGEHVYVAGFVDQAIAVFQRDAATGALAFVEAEFNGMDGVIGLDDP